MNATLPLTPRDLAAYDLNALKQDAQDYTADWVRRSGPNPDQRYLEFLKWLTEKLENLTVPS